MGRCWAQASRSPPGPHCSIGALVHWNNVATWCTLLHSIGVLVHWCTVALHCCFGALYKCAWCTVGTWCTWCNSSLVHSSALVHCSHLVPPGRSNNCNTTAGPGTTAQHRPSSSYSCPTLPSVITLRFLAIWCRSSTVASRLILLLLSDPSYLKDGISSWLPIF